MIYRVAVGATKAEPWLTNGPKISGLKFGPDGQFYAATQGESPKIVSIDPATQAIRDVATGVKPNDLIVSKAGWIYFTDTGAGQVQAVPIAAKSLSRPRTVAGGITSPNGIALSPKQDFLYVSEYGGTNVWSFAIAADGSLSAGERSMTLVVPYLRWLIEEDRKLTPLKELQGLIWEEGYGSGELQGPLYPDVAPALHRWRQAGLTLAVYSSGSVKAQQLIYGHSNAGDLRSWFHYWFDTRMGPKLEPASYIRIVKAMGAEASMVLFISDSIGELEAARSNGLPVLFSDRHGSDDSLDLPARFPTITSFDGLNPRRVA